MRVGYSRSSRGMDSSRSRTGSCWARMELGPKLSSHRVQKAREWLYCRVLAAEAMEWTQASCSCKGCTKPVAEDLESQAPTFQTTYPKDPCLPNSEPMDWIL